MNSFKVFVVDDDVAVLESMQALIQSMNFEVECFESAQHFLETWVEPDSPSCIILDVKMPGMNGLELQSHLVNQGIRIPIVIVSGHADIPKCVTAMKHGAIDFLEKPYRTQQLQAVVTKALEYDEIRRIDDEIMRELQDRFDQLTEQEKLVLDLMVSGTPNKQIASDLDISLRTVQFRRANIMQKLNVESRADLVRLVSKIDSRGSEQLASSADLGQLATKRV